jgi:hypothetical protein
MIDKIKEIFNTDTEKMSTDVKTEDSSSDLVVASNTPSTDGDTPQQQPDVVLIDNVEINPTSDEIPQGQNVIANANLNERISGLETTILNLEQQVRSINTQFNLVDTALEKVETVQPGGGTYAQMLEKIANNV